MGLGLEALGLGLGLGLGLRLGLGLGGPEGLGGLGGLRGLTASVSCFDPIIDNSVFVPEEHQDGDYLATVTISGNVAMAEQLINERLREQFQPRLGPDGKTLQTSWEFGM